MLMKMLSTTRRVPSRRNDKMQKLDVQLCKSITAPTEKSSDEEQETVLEERSADQVSKQLEEDTEYLSVEKDNLTTGT